MEQAMERIQRQLAEAEEAEKPKGGATEVVDKPRQLSDEVLAGIEAGNINIDGSAGERMSLSESGSEVRDNKQQLREVFDRRKRARSIAIPTEDYKVKALLREYGEPVCLFGEGPADRRARVTDLVADKGELQKPGEARAGTEDAGEEQKEVWYHEGPESLATARQRIAEYSLPRARDRLKQARLKLSQGDIVQRAETQKLHGRLRTMSDYGSQVGDNRPISFCRFSPDSKMLVTSSWSGLCKLWSVPDCAPIRTLRGHKERVGAIVWHPRACIGQGTGELNLASCAADGTVHMWDLERDTPMDSLKGHGARVARVAFHPSGQFLGSTCFDSSWRLWDLETKTEVLHQEGHSNAVYGIAFHPDGSLAGTSSLDASARLWDLRTGRNVLTLQGHVKQVLGIDFSPNGYHLATGSDDHSIRLWDIRAQSCVYTLPAHKSLISEVRFHRDCIISSSYDHTAKVWSAPECAPLRTLQGHTDKVMAVDIAADNSCIATASYDRTIKLWAPE